MAEESVPQSNDVPEGQPAEGGEGKPVGKQVPTTDKAINAAQEAAIKKWKLKIDNSEEEVDEKTLIEYAQKAKAADKRFQEAATTKKEAEAFFELVKAAGDDPILLEKVFAHPAMGNKDFRG